jgi:PAS domain S-box-containing protein
MKDSLFQRFLTNYIAIFEYQKSAVCFADVDGNIVWKNKVLEESIASISAHLEANTFDGQLKSLLLESQAKTFQLKDKYKDQLIQFKFQTTSFQIEISPMVLSDSRLAGFQIKLTQSNYEQANLTEEYSFRQFPLNNPNPIISINIEGKLVHSNPAAEELLLDDNHCLKPEIHASIQTYLNSSTEDFKKQVHFVSEGKNYRASLIKKGGIVFLYCSDVTDYKQLEKENADNLNLLGAIIDSSQHSVILLDNEKKISYFNQKSRIELRRYFGILLAIGDLLPDFDETSYSKTVNESLDIVFLSGTQISFDYENIVDSEKNFFKFTFYPVFNQQGNISGVCLNIFNSTKEKLAELEILKTKLFYETILNNIPADIAVFNSNHQYLFLNPSAIRDEELRKWLIGKDDFDFFKLKGKGTEIAEKRRQIFNQVLRSQTIFDFVDIHNRPNERPNYVYRKFYPVIENGKVDLVIGYGVDITKIKETENQVKLSETRFKQLFEYNPMLLFIVDNEYAIVSANLAAINHFSLNQDSIPGLDFTSLLSSSFCDEFKLKFSKLFESTDGQSQTCYCNLIRSQSEAVIEFTATKFIDSAGNATLMLVGADQTEQIENQQRLIKSENFNRELVRDMPIPFAISYRNKAEFMNGACKDLLGFKENEDYTNISIFDLTFEEDWDYVRENLLRRAPGLNTAPIILRMKTRLNEEIHVEFLSGTINLGKREVNFVSLIDRTQEFNQAREKAQAEASAKIILESVKDAIFTINKDGYINYLNPTAIDLFGYSLSEVNGLNILDVILEEEQREDVQLFYLSRLKSNTLFDTVFEIVLVNSSKRHFTSEVIVSKMKRQDELLLTIFIRDISHRKEAELALKASENRLSLLISTLPVVPYTTRSISLYDFNYLDDRIAELSGFTKNDYLANPLLWTSNVVVEDLSAISSGESDLVAYGEAIITYRIQKLNGAYIWIRDSMRYLFEDESNQSPYMITGVFQDITQEKEEEDRRRLIETTLVDISREELSNRKSLVEFYEGLYLRLNTNLGIESLSIWDYSEFDNCYVCQSCFHIIEKEQHKTLNLRIDESKFEQIIGDLTVVKSNWHNAEAISSDALNRLFEKQQELSLLLGVIYKTSDSKGFVLIEKSEKGFKWEYEHLALIKSISELISLNKEYFQRLEIDGKLQQAYSLAKIGAWEIDQDTNRSFWSEGMYDFYQLDITKEPLHFDEAIKYIHLDDVEIFKRAYKGLVYSNTPYNIECRHVFKDGTIRYFEKSAITRLNSSGKTVYVGVTIEITERRLAEILEARILHKRNILNSIGSAISPVFTIKEMIRVFIETLIENNSINEGCVFQLQDGLVYANICLSNGQNVTGNSLPELVENHIEQLLSQHDLTACLRLACEGINYLLVPVKLAEIGLVCFVFKLSQLFDKNSEIEDLYLSLIQLVKDRSDRIFAENQLKELNTELLENNIQMRQYSFIVSHNLRAPVANILGCLNLYNGSSPDDSRDKRLIDGIQVSANLVDNILQDLNKILNIKENISKQFEYIDFDKILQLVLGSLHKEMDEVDYEMQVDFSQLSGMKAFRPYLVSIFQNMLSNSFKYRDYSRKLIIGIRSYTNNGKLILAFSDNGRGIDMEKYGNTIFKLYARFHKDVPGSGLGLNMVQEQARALGGSTQITSQVGDGTTFTFTFVSKD